MTSTTGLRRLGDSVYQVLIEFPQSAMSIPRSTDTKKGAPDDSTPSAFKIDDTLVKLCQSADSVSSLLAKDPTLAPGEAWKKLYGHYDKLVHHEPHDFRSIGKGSLSDAELKKARDCGRWGNTEPSELFLRIYHDALCTLNEAPGHAMASPPLLGSSGVVPLTVISVIPDIVRHMGNLIVRAEKEVYLATNYWQNSVASKYITNAIKELNRRAGERGSKVIMKVLYDRGSPKQLLEPHYVVAEKEYTGKNVALPAKSEIPNIDLEVMNYHDPMLGTMHSKFMVVDRKIGVLQSNNIQDNDNLEMMIHLEGPIAFQMRQYCKRLLDPKLTFRVVDSLYETALLSWHKKLQPPLPSHDSPAALGGIGAFGPKHDKIFSPEGTIEGHPVVIDPQKISQSHVAYGLQAAGKLPAKDVPSHTESVLHPAEKQGGPSGDTEQLASLGTTSSSDAGKATTSGGPPITTDEGARTFLDASRQAIPQSQISDPSPAGSRLAENDANDPNYDADIAGEVARVQESVSAKPGETRSQAVTRLLNHTTNKDLKGNAPDCDPQDGMTPYIPHPTHQPFPIALVNRAPYGPPNHKSVANPQNAAWISALRHAKKNVFIQSPTLNAEPLVPVILETCERGIDVFCYVCLGYNDAGELLPMQGGHNEMIANHLYTTLSEAGKQHLHWFWYIGKDQTKPLIAERKQRSCHIKLMIVDEHIGIQGNGNQDTQSWFHSQEVNVMLDSADVCRAWIDGIRRNQNTHLYGAVSKEDGVWRDQEGKQPDGAMGVDPGRFSWAKGFVGAIKRVRGVGGF